MCQSIRVCVSGQTLQSDPIHIAALQGLHEEVCQLLVKEMRYSVIQAMSQPSFDADTANEATVEIPVIIQVWWRHVIRSSA